MASYQKLFQGIVVTGIAVMFCIFGYMFFGYAFVAFFDALFSVTGFSSSVLLILAAFVIYKGGLSFSSKPMLLGAFIFVFVFLGLIFDVSGNPIYNLPLEWLLAPDGTHLQASSYTFHYRGGKMSSSVTHHFMTLHGYVIRDVSAWIVYLYRTVNYAVVALLLLGFGQILLSSEAKKTSQSVDERAG